jgi:hypothetical protein
VTPPAWWHHRPRAQPVAKATKEATPVDPGPLTLFDVAPPASNPMDDWAQRVTTALRAHRTSRVRLSEEQAAQLLLALAAYEGQAVGEARLADLAGLPSARIGRYLTQLQDLVNIEGYGILTIVNGEARLDRPLLDRQLDLA